MKIFIFISLICSIIFFSCKSGNSIISLSQNMIEEVKLSSEIIAKTGIHAHGIVNDDKMNIYVGNNKEIIMITKDGKIIPFAKLENSDTSEYLKTFIYDLYFNKKDRCIYAASGDRILKITLEGKISTYIKENFEGRYGAIAVVFDDIGKMYITCGNKIFKYSEDLKKELFFDGNKSKEIKVEQIIGIEFDSTFKNLYFCESMYGQFIKCSIKNGKPVKLSVIFTDIDYAPEYIVVINDSTFLVKDPSFKFFYLIKNNKVKKIIVDNVNQKYNGIETILLDGKILYGTNYDDGSVYKINLSEILN